MTKREQLQAARELEGSCTIGAGAGLGKYTREDSECRRGRRGVPSTTALMEPVECPSEECPLCTGEACDVCERKWGFNYSERCEHDVLARHWDPDLDLPEDDAPLAPLADA